jgi:hypothetical protein
VLLKPVLHLSAAASQLLKDPVRACDGLVYERDAIEVRELLLVLHVLVSMLVCMCG